MAMDVKEMQKIIGDNVRNIRKLKGWTQEMLGGKTGLTKSRISNIEGAKSDDNYTLKTLLALSGGLGVPIECLVALPEHEVTNHKTNDPAPLKEVICGGVDVPVSEQDIAILRCLQKHGVRFRSKEDYICLLHVIKSFCEK